MIDREPSFFGLGASIGFALGVAAAGRAGWGLVVVVASAAFFLWDIITLRQRSK